MRISEPNRYIILTVGIIMMLFLGLIYGWSIFKAPFSAVYTTWTLTDLSMPFTVSLAFFCIGGFVGGKLTARIRHNIVILMASVLLFLGFFCVSRLNSAEPGVSLIQLVIFYGVFCGGGVGMAYNAVLGAVIKWFPLNAGFASGILLMGYGMGGMVLGSVVNVLIVNLGLFHAFFVLAVIITPVIIIGSFFIKIPTQIALKPNQTAPMSGVKDYPPSKMMKTRTFWIFFSWNIIIASGGLMVMNSAATIAAAFGAPAVLGLMVSVFNGGGRVLFGVLMDKLGRKRSMFIACSVILCAGISLYMGALLNSVIPIFVGLLLIGTGFASSPALSSGVMNQNFGAKYYAVNFSVNTFNLIPSAIVGPMIASALQERAGGAYNTTFIAIICFGVAAFAATALMNGAIAKEFDGK